MGHPEFIAGATNTAFLPQYFPHIFETAQQRGGVPFSLPLSPSQQHYMLALAAFQHVHRTAADCNTTVQQYMGGQEGQAVDLVLTLEGAQHPIKLRALTTDKATPADIAAGALEVEVGDKAHLVVPVLPAAGRPYCADLVHMLVDGHLHISQVVSRQPRGVTLQYGGAERTIAVQSPLLAQLEQYMPPPMQQAHQNVLSSPMAGSLISVAVSVGDEVLPGDDLAVVEAMKMRNVLKAQDPRRIKAVHAKAGDVLRADQVILEFEDV